ncbi:MAG: 2-dehydropantoate 2-reductase [Hyphomonadaceae bacterium]|nr:2-dehydropantoate 2-reductase [Hyphomonadaceae bacterium]
MAVTEPSHPRIVVAGAGSIGCYVGGCLALAGRDVTLLLRPALAQLIAGRGLRISDLDGASRVLAPSAIKLATDPAAAFSEADVILVTVKSGATAAMAGVIAEHAPSGATVVSLQNGVGNVDLLLARLGGIGRIVAGMVPFNVVQSHGQSEPARFHCATSGTMLVSAGVPGLRAALNVKGAAVAEHADMGAVLWGKLMLNLNNALNALAGVPLARELADRRWRLILARQIAEALAVLEAAHITPARIEGVAPGMIPRILRLPNWLFRRVAGRMLAIDPEARSSMWEDLDRRRPTEIDYLQGAILALAAKHHMPAPVTKGIVHLVKEAEAARAGSPGLTPEHVERAVA